MFRLTKATCLILGAIAPSIFMLFIPLPVKAQQPRLFPCPVPSELHLWGVRIYRDPKRTMMYQSSLIASLVADISGLASSRRCTWKNFSDRGYVIIEGWQIEVANKQNALKILAAAEKMGLKVELSENERAIERKSKN